jgi:hypothetical protein
MKLGIMQPYFFPYIGYFQLIKEVDEFVIYDDVNFIKGGWINRNRILSGGQANYINIPILGASSFKKINEISIGKDVDHILNKIRNSYSKAPYFKSVFPFISYLIKYETHSLSHHLAHSIIEISKYFDLNTNFIYSSNIQKDNNLKGQDKVLSICSKQEAKSYYNAIGGVSIYSKEVFENKGIKLKFIKSHNIEYKQYEQKFISNLSIIDVMMFNDTSTIKEYFEKYELI